VEREAPLFLVLHRRGGGMREQAALVSYLGKADLKAALLVEIGKHEQADQVAKGTYGEMNGQWHGCAIGCSLRSLNILQQQPDVNLRTGEHERFPPELGLPLWLAFAEDHIFENLPDDLATTWPRRFAEAIPLGVDLTDLVAPLMLWTLADPVWGVLPTVENTEVKKIVADMAELFRRTINGETVSESEWEQAARAAWDAWDAYHTALSEELLRLLRQAPSILPLRKAQS
jgi:hypothetical protein